ncbi:MAG: EF-P lysine aminoacylase GenX [Dehalococcoidales bacterium]|nr:EF-P lysine aminoacylase GenX [Dehalococcoidales bacterium]
MAIEEYGRLKSLKPNLKKRARIIQHARNFFSRQGFLEVDTPTRMPEIAPELNIVPITSGNWYLSTSPELFMKRLLAAGYEELFQIGHCFRQGERGRWHNPEFTMIEWYRTGADYLKLIEDTEHLVVSAAKALKLGSKISYQGQEIDLTTPWPRITVRKAYLQYAGWDPVADPNPLRFDTDMVEKVIPHFSKNRPTVIQDYPAPMASLARLKPRNRRVAERAEVFIGGLEIANAYSELINAEEQAKRFAEEIKQIYREQHRAMKLPLKFLESMKSLPECGGIALGMDRLVMLFCDATSIDEVMPFTVDTE